LILDTDAGEIPAILATCRTPLPDARNCFAFSTFGFAIGGLPNLIDRARAAACPRNMRSRRDCRRWCARSAETSNSDSPFEVSLSKPSSSQFGRWTKSEFCRSLPTGSPLSARSHRACDPEPFAPMSDGQRKRAKPSIHARMQRSSDALSAHRQIPDSRDWFERKLRRASSIPNAITESSFGKQTIRILSVQPGTV
jgi:hypothetical protein